MPRAAKSKISEIVGFFRAVSLEVMEVAKEMVDDVVRERKGKSSKAKARAQGAWPVTTAVAPPVAAPRKARKVKVTRAKSVGGKKRGPKPRNQPLPLSEDTDYGDVAVNTAAPAGQPMTLTAP